MEFPAVMEMFHICALQYGRPASHMWLMNMWNVAGVMEELHFQCFKIFNYFQFK